MAVRYTITDTAGCTHTRTSAGHVLPQYFFAVVRSPGNPAKTLTSFHGTERSARSALAAAKKPLVNNAFTRKHYPDEIGLPFYPDAAVYPVTAEVLGNSTRRAA